jgi:hypothetical protein
MLSLQYLIFTAISAHIELGRKFKQTRATANYKIAMFGPESTGKKKKQLFSHTTWPTTIKQLLGS